MKKVVSIIGGGASAIAVAAFLDSNIYDITIFEKNKALGRKFLVAGNGGFNLTHSEEISTLVERYAPNNFLKEDLLNFNNKNLRSWLKTIGIATYVGSSKRVYPTAGTKPIEVLKAIQTVIANNGVKIRYNKTWCGWDTHNHLVFKDGEKTASDITIFALGGASWKVTGSDGNWLSIFKNKGINVLPFQASNCAYQIQWPLDFIKKFAGTPLKNIAISCNEKKQKGEVVITELGFEGNAIYALSSEIRCELKKHLKATIYIDFKPTLQLKSIIKKLKTTDSKKVSNTLKNVLKLSASQIALLKSNLSKEAFLDTQQLADKIKQLPLTIIGSAPIDEAISTVGGIALPEVDSNYTLKKFPNTYCIGEMLNWDTPTGGYLLQACFSMGYSLAEHLNAQE